MNITLILGHPDRGGRHFCHALGAAYVQGAKDSGHEVRTIDVAALEFDLLRNADEWQQAAPCGPVREAQESIAWARHLVIVFPLWLGDMPARLKGFFEQAFRPGFAIGRAPEGRMWKRLLKGRSARILVTMGMPAFFYRVYYHAHSVRSLKRNILEFCGIAPVQTAYFGTVESPRARERALARVQALGRAGR